MTIPFTRFEGLFIGNRWVPAQGTPDAILNPATEAVIGEAPVGTAADADAAIAAARNAFDTGPWPRLTQPERAATMQKMRDALASRRQLLGDLLVAEVGTTRFIADLIHVGSCLEHFQTAITLSLRDDSYHLPHETTPDWGNPDGPHIIGGGTVVREPIGVVAGITGYNAPLLLNLSKVVPALLTGNTMVLKPSPFTPFSALLFGEIATEIGLPAGVLNVVTGGVDVGAMLTSDPRIDMVSFTGSEGVGASIMAQAAPTLKRVHLELGGKSALVVRHDADIQAAAATAIGSLTWTAGQGCALMTRYVVHNSVRAAFVAAFRAMAEHWKIGDPIDSSVMMGPLIRESQREKVSRLVQHGRDEGATLVFGGGRPQGLDKGFFYNITLFDDVDSASTVAQEEIFGPVGVVIGFDTDEEAIRIVNDSRFGLSSGIYSADPAAAWAMARHIRAGSVHLNGGMAKMGFGPIGGFKRSGIGREYGPHWLREFTQEKTIFYPLGR